MNAKCMELEVNMTTCVCQPGFTGDGLNCSGQFNMLAPVHNV